MTAADRPSTTDAAPPPGEDPPGRDSTLLAHLRALSVDERLALNDAAAQAALELRAAVASRR